MTSHTPAPWRYEAATKTIRAVPSNYWLASMNSWDGAVDHEANARLIAAAPEMLAALLTVAGKIGSYHDADSDDAEMHIISDMEETIDAILTKVYGDA